MTAGDLPEDGAAQVGPVPLPRGKRVLAASGSGQPVAWATSEPVPDAGMAWLALSDLHRESGLVPILITGLDDDGTRPWDDGEFGDPADVAQLDRMNAALVLETAWRDSLGSEEEEPEHPVAERAPFSRQFPGLAPSGDSPLTAAELRAVLAALSPARLALVPARRPADVLPLIGWRGVTNRWDDATPVAAVLRSWEARFGARLLQVGFADIQVLAERPPRDQDAAQRLAAEHYAFCDECGEDGLRAVSDIAARLRESPVWSFWWD
jgi:hypothetical protein